jgi:transposase-like protein
MMEGGLVSGSPTMVDFKGSHFEREIVLWGVRWYVAYPISYRQLEEMMEERGVEVDHSSLNRWVIKYVPLLDEAFRARKRRVGGSRAIKRRVRPMLGFKSFWSAAATLAGIELMHMIRKGQMKATGRLRPAQQFYALSN